ncbi:hypothetical protein B0T22DRAFT_460586 [Podospora appendiculata]|uniref:Secreted protein n=1 Tax=Podospora appendiculata TaxID=314037 RepID=A0AAE0XAU5_9PEZI|nr:hypothetical protein B0T22DRAFT_460586 [Podospora appendiculata]
MRTDRRCSFTRESTSRVRHELFFLLLLLLSVFSPASGTCPVHQVQSPIHPNPESNLVTDTIGCWVTTRQVGVHSAQTLQPLSTTGDRQSRVPSSGGRRRQRLAFLGAGSGTERAKEGAHVVIGRSALPSSITKKKQKKRQTFWLEAWPGTHATPPRAMITRTSETAGLSWEITEGKEKRHSASYLEA